MKAIESQKHMRTSERLSKREYRELHRALESVVLTRFPNPERKDCPGLDTLRAIAQKKLPMRHPSGDHVTRCSPCFSELLEIRKTLRQRRVVWSLATAAASILILTVLLGFVLRTPPDTAIPT